MCLGQSDTQCSEGVVLLSGSNIWRKKSIGFSHVTGAEGEIGYGNIMDLVISYLLNGDTF